MKKGQALGYVEQLGTFVAVEVRPAGVGGEGGRKQARVARAGRLCSWHALAHKQMQPWRSHHARPSNHVSLAAQAPQAGEIAKFLLEDGAPVEFRQEVVELAPFFGGHIIGDSKYA